mgnify:CR=1 FL=1
MPEDYFELKVRASSNARKVGSFVARSIFEDKNLEVRAVGAAAINQALKAIAIANGWTGPRGVFLAAIPAFTEVDGNDGTRITAMTFRVVRL